MQKIDAFLCELLFSEYSVIAMLYPSLDMIVNQIESLTNGSPNTVVGTWLNRPERISYLIDLQLRQMLIMRS